MRTFEQHIASNVRVSSYSRRHAPLFIIKAARAKDTRYHRPSTHSLYPTIFYQRQNVIHYSLPSNYLLFFKQFFSQLTRQLGFSVMKLYSYVRNCSNRIICFRLFKSLYMFVYSGVDKRSPILFSSWCAFFREHFLPNLLTRDARDFLSFRRPLQPVIYNANKRVTPTA